MEKKMVATGSVVFEKKTFYYEFWSNNVDVTVKMFHRGRKGDTIEFERLPRINLKEQMQNALVKAKAIKKA